MLEILLRFLVNLCSNDMHATNSPLQANIYCGVPGQWFFYSLLRFEFRPLIYPSKYHWFFPTSTCTFSQYFFSPPPKKWRIVYCSKKINLIHSIVYLFTVILSLFPFANMIFFKFQISRFFLKTEKNHCRSLFCIKWMTWLLYNSYLWKLISMIQLSTGQSLIILDLLYEWLAFSGFLDL